MLPGFWVEHHVSFIRIEERLAERAREVDRDEAGRERTVGTSAYRYVDEGLVRLCFEIVENP